MHAVVLGDSPVRLWGLTPAERIERQLRSEGIDLWRGRLEALPANETFLVLRGDCLYDGRVIRGLVKAPRHALLEVDAAGGCCRWPPTSRRNRLPPSARCCAACRRALPWPESPR